MSDMSDDFREQCKIRKSDSSSINAHRSSIDVQPQTRYVCQTGVSLDLVIDAVSPEGTFSDTVQVPAGADAMELI